MESEISPWKLGRQKPLSHVHPYRNHFGKNRKKKKNTF
jgi:hypothetical protein